MLGTTVDGVSMDTPSTFDSVSDSGTLRGKGSDVDVTTGGSMRWVILAIGAVAVAHVDMDARDGVVLAAAAATVSSLCCISQIFKCDRRVKSSSSFCNFGVRPDAVQKKNIVGSLGHYDTCALRDWISLSMAFLTASRASTSDCSRLVRSAFLLRHLGESEYTISATYPATVSNLKRCAFKVRNKFDS